MKKNLYYFLTFIFLLLVVVSIPSCKKDKCKAGTGGSLTLKLKTMHHDKYVYGLTVSLKFNTQDFPGEFGSYDISKTAGAHDSTLTFTGLQCGDYYIYGKGVDSTNTSTNKTVKGGIPFSTAQGEGTIEQVLSVTE